MKKIAQIVGISLMAAGLVGAVQADSTDAYWEDAKAESHRAWMNAKARSHAAWLDAKQKSYHLWEEAKQESFQAWDEANEASHRAWERARARSESQKPGKSGSKSTSGQGWEVGEDFWRNVEQDSSQTWDAGQQAPAVQKEGDQNP